MARKAEILEGDATLLRVPTESVAPNPDNPRLIFRLDELEELETSIRIQGILVPLTVYREGRSNRFVILDGERRWRCATRLRLERIPVIVQAKPAPLQNIMMMFAIHHARQDWDPLPSALKLGELSDLFEEQRGRLPKERELADLASMSVGEVRRLRQILDLPQPYIDELMAELELPRQEQRITVDQVLETTRGLTALSHRKVLRPREVEPLRRSIVDKYRAGVIESTVDPRLLARVARSVERNEVGVAAARKSVLRLKDEGITIRQVFETVGARSDAEHQVELAANRLANAIAVLSAETETALVESVRGALRAAREAIDSVLDE
jgi:ParB family transcriptional regulator, chromosome partitioning protein